MQSLDYTNVLAPLTGTRPYQVMLSTDLGMARVLKHVETTLGPTQGLRVAIGELYH